MPTSSRVRRTPTVVSVALSVVALCGAALCATTIGAHAAPITSTPPVQVTTLASGLTFPWDLSFTPDGTMLFDQRPGTLSVRRPDGTTRQLTANFSDLFVGSESGLEGLVVDPAFASNRRFYTCQAYKGTGSSPVDLRVIRWSVDSGYTAATRVGSPVVTGLPITSGRHGGCRLRFAPDGTLRISAGDAATGTNPQNLQALGGKTLRVHADGTIPTDNPFYAKGGNARYVYSYGHRNPQGLALRPGTSEMWEVEHGTAVDDEVNVIARGANYGYDPVPAKAGNPSYDESVPMTDTTKFPSAVKARWSSGDPTIAPSGGTFLTGSAWGRWQGALAVGVLKDTGVMVLTVDPAGTVVRTERIPALQHSYGRIRAAQLGPDHALYLTTSNGSDDKILRVAPTAQPTAYHAGLDVSPAGVSAAVRPDGLLAVLTRSPAGHPWVVTRTAAGTVHWQALPYAGKISAPAIVATGGTRLDGFATDTATGAMLHWTYNGTSWGAAQSLAGRLTSAPAAATLGRGTLDVVARGTDNGLWRRHFDGAHWGSWASITGRFTSAPGLSADAATGQLHVVGRGTDGHAWTRTLTARSALGSWVRGSDILWSARSLAPATSAGAAPYALDTSFDGAPVLTRGAFVDGLNGNFRGAPAVAVAAGRGPVVVGRAPSGSVWMCDATHGHCAMTSLGGVTG